MKKYPFIGILILLLGTVTIPLTQGLQTEKPNHIIEEGNNLYVGGFGPDNYSKIQDAIDNASDGDTIFVYNRTYYEHLVIKKKLNIIGKNQKDTIIRGIEESGFIIKISGMGSGTRITGFTILSDITECYGGILLSHSSENTIENNTIIIPKSMGSWSILFYSESNNNIIRNNNISGHGIEIEGANNNIIIENSISKLQNFKSMVVIAMSDCCKKQLKQMPKVEIESSGFFAKTDIGSNNEIVHVET